MRFLTQLKMTLNSTPLHTAIRYQDSKMFQEILSELNKKSLEEKGEFLNKLDKSGKTAIFLADLKTIFNQYDYLFVLLEAGANPYLGGHNPLNTYVSARRLDWVKLLLWYNTNYKEVDCDGCKGEDVIKRWDVLHKWDNPRSNLKILAEIEKTIADINTCQQYIKLAQQAQERAAINDKAIILEQKYYLQAATDYQNAAIIIENYSKIENITKEEQAYSKEDCAALIRHYQKKTLQLYQHANNCYEKVPIAAMTEKQQIDFLAVCKKCLLLGQALKDPITEECYALKISKLYSQLTVNLPEEEKRLYEQKAEAFYTKQVEALQGKRVFGDSLKTAFYRKKNQYHLVENNHHIQAQNHLIINNKG